MKNWSELQIGIVYYAGLILAILASILVLVYLSPVKNTIKKISKRFNILWSVSFKTTILIAGLLGAIVISFRDCTGKYDYLLNSRVETLKKGFEQVSSSFKYLLIILILWLVIFLVLFLVQKKEKE